MANLIQIKRSLTSAIPGSLANGELAYTAAGDIFYVGSPNGSIVAIGGARTPGILTANQALVANASSYLDKIKVANATIDKIYANGSFGTAGQLLTTDASGNVYWNTPAPSVVGTNTQVQFNDEGNLGASPNFTFDKTTGTLTLSNTLSTAYVLASSGVNSSVLQVGSSFVANSSRVTIGTSVGISANGSIGNDGNVLVSNGTTAYWDTRVASVSTGDGLTGGFITSTGTIAVLANNGIVSNGAGVFVLGNTGVTVNATGVHIGQPVGTTDSVTFNAITATGNVALGDSSGDVLSLNGHVNTNIIPTSDLVYDLGSSTARWANVNAGAVRGDIGIFSGNVQISGNLSVLGTVFTVSSNNLIIDDSMIQLGANNVSSDLLDIGFYGNYNGDGGAHEHAGLFRDATDDTFKLFKGLQDAPTTTVNTAGVGYTLATLQSYLNSGALVSNSTTVSITANSTISVGITANTLTLTSALAGTSGGTGRLTTTNQALLVGNTTNGYDELTVGADGYVLQSNGSAILYAPLDGGTF